MGEAAGGLYRLDRLDLAVAEGLDGHAGADSYDDHQHRLLDHYVELQLWSDTPIAKHLPRH
jgi:hypothetical protein